MWWVLWWSQTSRRTTCPACFHAHRSHPYSLRPSSKTVGGISQGNIIFVMVRAWWEWVSASATHTVLLAGSWLNLICTFYPSHLQVMHTTRSGGWREDSDVCVQAQQCIPATVSCHPLIPFSFQPSGPRVEWYISRPARNSLNSRDRRQFNFVFIPSRKISFSHHNNFSYGIKVYSPFHWSLTHFVRTSGIVLLIVEIHMHTFLPLLIPF